jgi:hypothetical protein
MNAPKPIGQRHANPPEVVQLIRYCLWQQSAIPMPNEGLASDARII